MAYLVLARKYRPQRLDEVVGQAHVTRTLANAIRTDRVAHAFVFSGVRGVGKTSLARILAKSLNCTSGPTVEPCGTCDSCRSIAAGTAVDVIEIDGASNNSVDDIRELRETVPYRPAIGRFKIYVIDEVHMLSVSAFNALLKTLEEPPPHVKFIFATTEPHKIPTTILSRCQRYDFRRIPTAAIVARIRYILEAEGIQADEGALAIIGREAEGSMRDALSVLDQVLAAGGDRVSQDTVAELLGVVSRRVYYDLSAAVLAEDPRLCLEIVRDVDRQGYDTTTFARGLLEHLRNLLVAGVCGGDRELLDLPEDEIAELAAQAQLTTGDTLHRLFKHFGEAYEEIARSSHPRILLEATVARLSQLGQLVPAAELVERLEALVAAGSGPKPQGGGGQPRRPQATPSPSLSGASTASTKSTRSTASTASAPPAPKAAGTDALHDGTAWSKLLEEFGAASPAKSSILERAEPAPESRGDLLVLQFDERDGFTAERAREQAFSGELRRFLRERLGRDVRLQVRLADLGGRTTVARERLAQEEMLRNREDEAREHPVVRGALSAFGGTIAKIAVAGAAPKPRRD